jgi:hypothetical protein
MAFIPQNIISEVSGTKNFDCGLLGYDTESQHW